MKKRVWIIVVAAVLIIAGIAAFAAPAIIQSMKAGELRKDPMKYLIYAGMKSDFNTPKSVEISVDDFMLPNQLENFLSTVRLTPEKASEIISKFTLMFAVSNFDAEAKGDKPMLRYKGLLKYDADDLISFDFTMAKQMLKLDFAPVFNLNMVGKLEQDAQSAEQLEKMMKLFSKYMELYKVDKEEIKTLIEDREIEETLRKFFRSAKLVGSENVSVGGSQVRADRIEMEFTMLDVYELVLNFMEQLQTNRTLRTFVENKFDQFVDSVVKDKDYELFGVRTEAEMLDLKNQFREQLDGLKDQVAYFRANVSRMANTVNPNISSIVFIHDNKIKRTDNVIAINVSDEGNTTNNMFLEFKVVTQDEPSFKLPGSITKDSATIEVDSTNPQLSREDIQKIKDAVVKGLQDNKAFEKIVNTVSEVTGLPLTKDILIYQLENQLQMMIEEGVKQMNF